MLDSKYKNKYLKYKNKYLNLQSQIGGVNGSNASIQTLPDDILSSILNSSSYNQESRIKTNKRNRFNLKFKKKTWKNNIGYVVFYK